MTANIGTIDRIARIVIGLALIAATLGLLGPSYQSACAWIGIIPLVPGLVGWCPLCSVLGIRTCKTPQAG
jgi:hypothetical protein